MPKLKFTPFQIFVHAAAWVPLAWLLWDFYAGNLSVNPIQDATQRTGRYALTLLVLSLACTPANTLFGFRPALTVRRALGLYAFLYASLHFILFAGVDYSFDWGLLKGAIFEKPFALIGLAGLLILIGLAITSTRASMKRMGKNWKQLHNLVYVAGVLLVVHYAWAVKGNVLRLQGNIQKPLIYGGVVALLLVARIPAVRRGATVLRAWLRQRRIRLARAYPRATGTSPDS